MKFGVIPLNIRVGAKDADEMIELGQKAEEAGYESIWTFEHTIYPLEYESKYPYSEDGKMGGTPDIPMVDPLIALTAVAANTTTIRLGTGVNILPQTNPVYLAKQVASLDFVSKGRFELGVGLGWLREEFEAIGVPFERRGARFDDYIVAMRKFWSGEVVEHQSEFISWSGFQSYPLPVQRPGPPIVIGGAHAKALERTAKLGDGFFAAAISPENLEPLLPALEAACQAEGRDVSSVDVSCMWFPSMTGIDAIKRFEDMGVYRLIIHTLGIEGGGTPVEAIQRFADETLSKL